MKKNERSEKGKKSFKSDFRINGQNVIVGSDDKWALPTDPLEMVITNPEKT